MVITTLELAHSLPDLGEAAAAAMVECDDQRGHLHDTINHSIDASGASQVAKQTKIIGNTDDHHSR